MADETERLLVLLEARISDFEKKFAQAERRGTSTYGKLREGSRSATRAMEEDMVRTSGRINQALASTSSEIGKWRAGFDGVRAGAAVAGLTALVGAARTAARSVAEIGDAAERAGVSAEAFQKLAYVAEQNRIPLDGLVDGLKELNLRADEFVVTGKGPAAEAFARLGYSAEELKAKLADPSELLVEMIGRLGRLDQAAQIRVADEVFGGTAGERFVELVDEGEAGIRSMMSEAERLGIVMDDELIAKAAELDRQFAAVSATIGSTMKTAIVNAASALDGMLTKFQAWTQSPTVAKYLGYIGIAPTDDARRRVQSEMGATEDPRSGKDRGIYPPEPETTLPEIVVEDDKSGGVGGGRGGGARERADAYQREAEAIARRTAAMEAGTAAQAEINPLMDEYGRASAEAAARAELLTAAQQAGLEVTPELRAEIEALAAAYADAEEAAGKLEVKQDEAKDRAQEWQDLRKDTTRGLISDLIEGTSAADAFANALGRIGDKLIDMALDDLFPSNGGGGGGGGLFSGLFSGLFGGGGGGGGGGLLGGAIIPGILHDGGRAGRDGYGHGRAFPAGTWAGAPRYHGGGIAGLKPNEVPAILERGETVLPAGGAGGGAQQRVKVEVDVGVSVDRNGDLKAFVRDVAQTTTRDGLDRYDRQLGDRVAEINGDPRYRG